MDIKLLVTDLDDTLIAEPSGISKRALKAFTKVKEKGIKAAIATGRMHSSAFPFASELNLSEPIISFNGALIKPMDSEEVILHLPVEYEKAIEVLEFAKEMKKFIMYYSLDDYYVQKNSLISMVYAGRIKIKPIVLKEELTKALDFSPMKLLMICDRDGDNIYNAAVKRFKNKLNITRSNTNLIEFNNAKASKGNACKVLAEYYGFDLENIMALGNGGNDVDMIKRCGLGIAVDNAVPEAKEAADYICPSQAEDGVAAAVERFLLKG